MLEGFKRRLFGRKYRVIVSTLCGLHFANETVRAKSERAARDTVAKHYAETGHTVKIIRVDEW